MKLIKRDPRVGTLVAIPDALTKHVFYAVVCMGNDWLFLDHMSSELQPDWRPSPPYQGLMRLFISISSIKRTGCRAVGSVPVLGEVAEFGRYLNRPVGSRQSYVYDEQNASLTPASTEDEAALEPAAVWELDDHLLPVLRFHFLGADRVAWVDRIKRLRRSRGEL
jgi:hypothetical protein